MSTDRLPPGPRDGFFGMREMARMKADVTGYYAALHKEYGDTVSMQTGPYRLFFFFHPAAVHEVLVKQAKSIVRLPRIMQTFAQWNGRSILIAEGKQWAQQRRLVQQAFQPRRINAYAKAIVNATQTLLETWEADSQAGDLLELDVRSAMRSLTLSVICRTMFDSDVSADSQEISAAVESLSQIAFNEMQAPVRLPSWIPTPANLRKRRAIAVLDRVVWKFIRDRRQEGKDHGDLLSMLLAAVDDQPGNATLSDQQVRDEAMTLMLAGHDTTAAALEWLLYVLGRYPEVTQKCHQEVEATTPEQLLTAELPYLTATIQETLRLYPPAFAVFARQSTVELEISGYTVPKGSMLALSSFVTQRDERWFPNPLAFQPERFLNQTAAKRPPGAYFPFGAGPRVCIGQSFATQEIKLAAAVLLRNFEFELAPESKDPQLEVTMALRPQTPIKLLLRKR